MNNTTHTHDVADCPTGRVLVVDDHRQARESVAETLRHFGHVVTTVGSAVEALQWLGHHAVDVIITDLNMPGMDGLDFIRELERRRHGAQVVMITAYATVSAAVEAMRHGAFDFLEKPFDADRLSNLVNRALRHGRMLDARLTAPGESDPQATPMMVGSSALMTALRQTIYRIASTDETVLITGESGTGKELIARAIHAQSPRSHRPLVMLNCPVLSAHLMESELFGHEKGAFTGADAQRIGRFELSDGGTILLDEITEIGLSLQAKLLRVLQERSFERVGSSQSRQVNVRVLATTNRDLPSEISAGNFRADLFYRLNVLPIHVPPLRERRGDISELIRYFLDGCARRLGHEACELAPSASELLLNYDWPGNVRELQNIVTRASVLSVDGRVTADQLRPWLIQNGERQTVSEPVEMCQSVSLQAMERKLIESTLEKFAGHRARTAQALGIGLRTLSGKLKEYGYKPRAKSLAQVG